MFRYRIDPTWIKMTDTTQRVRGGQGVVILGSLSLSTIEVDMVSKVKEVITALRPAPESHDKYSHALRLHFDKRVPEWLAQCKALGMPHEELNKAFHQMKKSAKIFERIDGGPNEQHSELKVAVKALAWRQDDLMKSAKFFKVRFALPPPWSPIVLNLPG